MEQLASFVTLYGLIVQSATQALVKLVFPLKYSMDLLVIFVNKDTLTAIHVTQQPANFVHLLTSLMAQFVSDARKDGIIAHIVTQLLVLVVHLLMN